MGAIIFTIGGVFPSGNSIWSRSVMLTGSRNMICAVLTISDTRSEETDTSGALLAERLRAAGHELAARAIVKDEVGAIEGQVAPFQLRHDLLERLQGRFKVLDVHSRPILLFHVLDAALQEPARQLRLDPISGEDRGGVLEDAPPPVAADRIAAVEHRERAERVHAAGRQLEAGSAVGDDRPRGSREALEPAVQRIVLTRTNAELLGKIALPAPESVTVTGAGGTPVQMWIVKPPQFDANKKYPLVFWVHGGPQGAFLDSSFDKISEVIIFAGIAFGGLADPFWCLVAIGISILVSYTRARAESLGVELKGIGIGERAERMLILAIIGMIPLHIILPQSGMYWAVIIVAIVAGITLIQRIAATAKKLST